MIVPDINLLVYAYNEAAPLHARASTWWRNLMNGRQPVGVPWATTFGFIRLLTHPAVLVDPLPVEEALLRVETWFQRTHVRVLEPGSRHLGVVRDLFAATGVGGNLTTDTHLAALAIENQAELHSNDADFARFPGLRFVNPLK